MIDSLCPCCRGPVDVTPELVMHAGVQLLAHRYKHTGCPTCPELRRVAREALADADSKIAALRLALAWSLTELGAHKGDERWAMLEDPPPVAELPPSA